MHEQLSLVIGFEKGVTTANAPTAELPLRVLALIGTAGFALDPIDGWLPQIAALKEGGVWAESSTSAGRTLIAGEDGNVTETMRLTVGTGDARLLYTYIVRLNRFIELARQHWTTFFQTLPVYLNWKAVGAPGHQYALVYNIDAAVDYNPGGDAGLAEVTLSVEREPYWRALPPGANPKRWALEKAGEKLLFNNDALIPGAPGRDLKTATIANKLEWSPAALGLQTALLSQNYVEIGAAEVPGDAPALVQFSIRSSSLSLRRLYVAKSTKPTSGVSVSSGSATRYNAYILAAGDAGLNVGSKVDVTAAPAVGVRSNGSSTVFYNYQRTVPAATTAFTPLLAWGRQYTGNLLNLDRTLMSGKFALFIRCATTNGSNSDLIMRAVVEEYEDAATQVLAARITADDIGVQVSGVYLILHYAGVITIPFSAKRNATISGFGRQIRNTLGDFRIRIECKNTAGANRDLQLSDLIMIPIDDEAVQLTLPFEGTGSPGTAIYDNTGYFDLSAPNGIVKSYISQSNNAVGGEIDGGTITLEPAQDQRLYFLMDMLTSPDGSSQSPANETAAVSVNIIPRWRGPRDA